MSLKDTLVAGSVAIGLPRLAQALMRGRLAILCYHAVWFGPGSHHGRFLYISPGRFARRLEILRQGGYRVLDLEDALGCLAEDRLPEKAVVITIDDGWYSTYRHMLPALEAAGFPATLYVYSDPVVHNLPVFPVLLGYLMAKGRPAKVALHELVGEGDACYNLDLAEDRARLPGDLVPLLGARTDGGGATGKIRCCASARWSGSMSGTCCARGCSTS